MEALEMHRRWMQSWRHPKLWQYTRRFPIFPWPGHEGLASWKMVPDLSQFTNTYLGINSDCSLTALQQVQVDPSRKILTEFLRRWVWSHVLVVVLTCLQQCCNSPWRYAMSLPRLPQVQLSLVPAHHPVLGCSGASSPALLRSLGFFGKVHGI